MCGIVRCAANDGLFGTTVLRAVGIVLLMADMSAAQASPRIAQQTGEACSACHYADLRSLNAQGRMYLRLRDRSSKEDKSDFFDKDAMDVDKAGNVESSTNKAIQDEGAVRSMMHNDDELE